MYTLDTLTMECHWVVCPSTKEHGNMALVDRIKHRKLRCTPVMGKTIEIGGQTKVTYKFMPLHNPYCTVFVLA